MQTRHPKASLFPAQLAALVVLAIAGAGCHSLRTPEEPTGPHVRVLTYNVNWGGARPDLTAQAILEADADIVCLQETTPEWEQYLKRTLIKGYPSMEFRNSTTRMGGGLAILAKLPFQEAAYVPSETGWFDGWLVKCATAIGPVQIINVHLRPPISDSGSWVSGYFTTATDRKTEMQRFFGAREKGLPTLVMGDFNDGEKGLPVRWLESQGLDNALPQFDRSNPTWTWQYGVVKLRRRMDHILYTP